MWLKYGASRMHGLEIKLVRSAQEVSAQRKLFKRTHGYLRRAFPCSTVDSLPQHFRKFIFFSCLWETGAGNVKDIAEFDYTLPSFPSVPLWPMAIGDADPKKRPDGVTVWKD